MTVSLRKPFVYLSAFLSLGAALLMTGCGIGELAPLNAGALNAPGMMHGTVLGGRTPISGAVVTLYQAGSTGYGKGFTALATTTTDSGGSFSFGIGQTGAANDWSCPSDGTNPLIYLMSVGGNPGTGSSNPDAVLVSVLGPCSGITSATTVNIDEVATAATAAAFSGWIYPGTTIGSEGIGSNGSYCLAASTACTSTSQSALGLYNAWLTYSNNLVNIATGTAITSGGPYSGTAGGTVQVTATPEAPKLLSIANILASCVQADPSSLSTAMTPCATLFGAATVPVRAASTSYGSSNSSYTFSKAVDTFQAAIYMQLNPADLGGVDTTDCGSSYSSNPACLLGLVVGTSKPYVGDLADQGVTTTSDWTIGISYTASGTCSAGGKFIDAPYRTAVDASGNVFFINNSSTTGGSNLSEIGPYGVPLFCAGGHTSGRDLTIDPSGNVWASFYGSATSLYELQSGATSLTTWSPTSGSYGVVSDGIGNIYYTNLSTGGSLYKITSTAVAAGALSSNNGTLLASPLEAGTNSPVDANYLAFDPNGNFWAVNQDTTLVGSYNPNGQTATKTINCKTWTFSYSTKNLTCTPTGTTPSSVLAMGDEVTLSGFTSSASTTVGLNNVRATVTSAGSTTYVMNIYSADTSTSENNISDSGGLATVNDTTFGLGNTTISGNVLGNAIDSAGYIYTGQVCCSASTAKELLKFTTTATGTATSSRSVPYQGGTNGSQAVALDGAGNLWVANELSATDQSLTSTQNYPVTEVAAPTSGGTTTWVSLSPDGTAPTSCSITTAPLGCPSGGGFLKTSIGAGRGISVDPSGNVWLPIVGTQSSLTSGTNIVQIVGAAVPVVTPISAGLASSKLATKP